MLFSTWVWWQYLLVGFLLFPVSLFFFIGLIIGLMAIWQEYKDVYHKEDNRYEEYE